MTEKNLPSHKKEKMPSVRAPQSAKATESKALKRKLFDDGNEKKTPKSASLKRKKTSSQPGSPTLNTTRPHPLSERQQLALLKQQYAKEKAKDSSPGKITECTPVKHSPHAIISTFKTNKGVNKKNERGETALHRAAINGDVQLCKSLISQGADVNVKDFASWTPLHEACNHGYFDVAKQLLKGGAYVNSLGLDDDTPLHDAAINGHVRLVQLLLEHGANPLQANKKGKAPIDLAELPQIRALMKNEIIESCSDSSLLDAANSPTSPESLSSAEECNAMRDTNGDARLLSLQEPDDPYKFTSDEQPSSEQKKITIHYKVPVKNGKPTRVMDVIKIPKTTQTLQQHQQVHQQVQQQERQAAGTPNSLDSLSSGDSDLFDPHLTPPPQPSKPTMVDNNKLSLHHGNDVVYGHQEKQQPSVLTAAASTPSSSSTPKHATPRLPVQEQSELARIPETRDDSESSLSESNLYISDDSNLASENRSSVSSGKADSTTELLMFPQMGHTHTIKQTHPHHVMRSVENTSVLANAPDSSVQQQNAGVCIPGANYSRVGMLTAHTPQREASSLTVNTTPSKHIQSLPRTTHLPSVQNKHNQQQQQQQQSANSENSRNSPDSQVSSLESLRRTASASDILNRHAAVSAKSSVEDQQHFVSHIGNRQPSVLPQEAQVHADKPDSLKSESDADSLPEWRTDTKPSTAVSAAESSKAAASSESDSHNTTEKPHHGSGRDRERTKKHKERSDKKSHRKHHRHSQGSVRSSKEEKESRHAAATATTEEASTSSLSSSSSVETGTVSSPSRLLQPERGGSNPSVEGESSRTDLAVSIKAEPPLGGKELLTSKDVTSTATTSVASAQRQSPSQFSVQQEYYVVTPPPSSSADEASSEIKSLVIRLKPNIVQQQQCKSKEPAVSVITASSINNNTAATTTSSSVSSSTSASSSPVVETVMKHHTAAAPDLASSKSSTSSSFPSVSESGNAAAAAASSSSTAASCMDNTATMRKSPSSEVGNNRRSPVTRDTERRKSPGRGAGGIADIASSSTGFNSGKNSPKMLENFSLSSSSSSSGEQLKDDKPKPTRTLRSNSNLNATTNGADSNGNSEKSSAETTVMTRSRRAATTTESSNNNGNESGGASAEGQSVEESHSRKRKIARHKEQQPIQEEPYQHPMPTPLPPQDKVNTMEMFINIRNEVSQRQKTLISAVQPKVPNNFQEYLMFRKSYLLQGSPETKVNVAIPEKLTPPVDLPNPLLSLFEVQEKVRYALRMRHYIERDKLMLSAEQDIMRVYGKAARAYANQRIPFSACVVFRDQEVYNMPEPLPMDDGKNIRTRFNGRQMFSLLQDVDIKYERIKEELLQRHQHEATSLYAMQRLDWELRMQDLKMWDLKVGPKITTEHVPMVSNRDFDLLPHVRHV